LTGPISNSDRLVRQLRQRLEKRARTQAAVPSTRVGAIEERPQSSAQEAFTNLARGGLQREGLRRLLIEQLLLDQFGSDVVNDASFQQLTDRVTQMMQSDAEISQLIDQTLLPVEIGTVS
jgi:hypothetical protein